MDEKRHPSIRILRILCHIQANFLRLLEEFPGLKSEIDKSLENFIKDEANRDKDVISNLGGFLAYMLVSFKFKLEDIIKCYSEEQLDRQVFWLLRSIPELIQNHDDEKINSKRANITFKSESTSYHITCAYAALVRFFQKNFKNP